MDLWSLKKTYQRFLTNPAIGSVIRSMFGEWITSRGQRIFLPYELETPRLESKIFCGFYEKSEIKMIDAYLHMDYNVIELGSSLGVV